MGFQKTPVLSMATWVTLCASSQSRSANSCAAVVPKVRTCWTRSPGPAGTRASPRATTITWSVWGAASITGASAGHTSASTTTTRGRTYSR